MKTQVPENLRKQVAKDLRPVKPVSPPQRRLLLVMLWALAALIAVPAFMGVRFNAPQLGIWLLWGTTGVEAVVGGLLILLALREAIPGLGASKTTTVLALLGSLLLELGIAFITQARCPCPDGGFGVACFSSEMFLGIPALGLTLFLVVRAFPLSPTKAGAFGGVGSGLIADAIQHTLCPVSDLRHVLVWHLGAVGALGMLGFVFGLAWQAWRLARFKRDTLGRK